MSSNRPETSVPSNTSEPVPTKTRNDTSSGIHKPYVPTVFDLVFPTGRARALTGLHIPPEFLQSDAVDSSLLIGHGASFTVSRQAIPPGADKIVVRTDMGGWTLDKVTKSPKRPQYVVYKSARVRFLANGEPATLEDGRAMLSVLTELHALLHPPLRSHPNIITLLGLAWGSNHAEPLHRLPILVIEYGDKGTLADVQSGTSFLPRFVKTELCRGIAYGLQALHDQGIVHGDMKPENIIICSDQNGSLVPKLADFGFAIIESSENVSRYIAGTRTWRAPESFAPVPVAKLKSTDIYSFGLVVWSVAAHTNDPFRLVLPLVESQEKRFDEIDRLKMSDEVMVVSQIENWFVSWLLETSNGNQLWGVGSQTSTASINQLVVSVQQLIKLYNDATPTLKQNLRSTLTQTPGYLQLVPLLFPQHLNSIFQCTVTKNPDQRNLKAAIGFLEDQETQSAAQFETLSLQTSKPERTHSGVTNHASASGDPKDAPSGKCNQNDKTGFVVTNASNQVRKHLATHTREMDSDPKVQAVLGEQSGLGKRIDWANLGFKFPRFSWQVTRDLEPAIQSFVVGSLLHRDGKESIFFQSACLANGYGVKVDLQRAVNSMIEAASKGHPSARANLHRMAAVCGEPLSADVPILKYLRQAALQGSRPALLDLCRLNPEEGKHCRKLLRYGYGGVGASWYAEDQWLCGLTQGSFLHADFKCESLGPKEGLSDLVVNLRGDHILHAAAAIGARGTLKPLLEEGTLSVNQQNARGETALLCACRSGHADVVLLLLDNGADASLQALNGESPLHWLSSFDPEVNPAMVGKDLIERGGARMDAFTTEPISHSPIFNSIDVDFQMPGTPLTWAVHDNNPQAVAFLLAKGADPQSRLKESEMSPLQWAAFYHHTECLKLMIDHLEHTRDVPVDSDGNKDYRYVVEFGPLVQYAIHAADNFSMILRNGASCLNMLESTLLYLQEKTKLIKFKLDGDDTLLHFAAREGHGEAIRFILAHDWLVNEINDPAGRFGRTAILESVRWNHISLFHGLRKHGADPCILSASPYDESETGRLWSALHLFADQAHNDNLALIDDLLAAGVPVDGDRSHSIETPLNVSIRRNAFRLSDHLRAKGASLETTSRRSALLTSRWKLTILGHTVALNSRYCFDSLQYLLHAGAEFLVCPERGLTALHLCAMVPEGLTYLDGTPLKRAEFDTPTSRMITRTLLEHFCSPEQLNARLPNVVPEALIPQLEQETDDLAGTLEFFAENGETALHLAVEVGNVQVVELLVSAGADKELVCYNETLRFETASDIAERMWSDRQPELYRRLMDFLGD